MEEQQPHPTGDSDASSEAELEALRQQLFKAFLADGIDKKLAELEPQQRAHPYRTQTVVSAALLLVLLVIVALGLSPLHQLGLPIHLPGIVNDKAAIRIANGGPHRILFLSDQPSNLDVQSYDLQSNQVLDVSRGRAGIQQASLSNDDSKVAFTVVEPSGTALYVTEFAGAETRILDSAVLTRAVTSSLGWVSANICPWSDLLWSSTNTQIAFFVCADDASALFVVDSQTRTDPIYLAGTKSTANTPRSATWTPNDSIIATGGEHGVDSLIKIDPVQSKYELIYGPRN